MIGSIADETNDGRKNFGPVRVPKCACVPLMLTTEKMHT